MRNDNCCTTRCCTSVICCSSWVPDDEQAAPPRTQNHAPKVHSVRVGVLCFQHGSFQNFQPRVLNLDTTWSYGAEDEPTAPADARCCFNTGQHGPCLSEKRSQGHGAREGEGAAEGVGTPERGRALYGHPVNILDSDTSIRSLEN